MTSVSHCYCGKYEISFKKIKFPQKLFSELFPIGAHRYAYGFRQPQVPSKYSLNRKMMTRERRHERDRVMCRVSMISRVSTSRFLAFRAIGVVRGVHSRFHSRTVYESEYMSFFTFKAKVLFACHRSCWHDLKFSIFRSI